MPRILASARRAPRRARPGPVAGRRTRAPRSPGSPSTRSDGSTPSRCTTRSPETPTPSPWSRSCGPTTRSAPSSRSPTAWPRPPPFGVPVHSDAVQAAGHLAARLRRVRSRRPDRQRAQARRSAGRRARCCSVAPRHRCRWSTVGDRSATSAPARSTPPRSPGSPPRWPSRPRTGLRSREAVAALRDDLVARVLEAVPDAVLNGDPAERPRAPVARQRPPVVPRLRG